MVGDRGVWTLTRLGGHDLRFPLRSNPEFRAIRYRLPAGARQGTTGTWYLVRLHFRIAFAKAGGDGLAYVGAATDGRPAAMVKFKSTGSASGSRRIEMSSVDLVDGYKQRTLDADSVDVHYTNYLQDRGVRGGVNTLSFRLDRFGDLKVRELQVLADSAIVVSGRGPAKLVLRAHVPSERVHAGDTFTIWVDRRNRGGRPARDVSVEATPADQGLEVVSAKRLSAGTVAKRLRGAFEIRALAPGRHKIELDVSSNTSRPAVVVDVDVGEGSAGMSVLGTRVGGLASVLAAIVIAGTAARRRRREA
jgi:hypothetical protein